MSKIRGVKARLFKVPLDEVLVHAKHGAHSHFHLITATITLSDGRIDTGYTYTGGAVVWPQPRSLPMIWQIS